MSEPVKPECCCCSCPDGGVELTQGDVSNEPSPPWIMGSVASPAGDVPVVTTTLNTADILGGWKARWTMGRMSYRIEPGLYAVGNPSPDSHVFVSANYKMSFDRLRSAFSQPVDRAAVRRTWNRRSRSPKTKPFPCDLRSGTGKRYSRLLGIWQESHARNAPGPISARGSIGSHPGRARYVGAVCLGGHGRTIGPDRIGARRIFLVQGGGNWSWFCRSLRRHGIGSTQDGQSSREFCEFALKFTARYVPRGWSKLVPRLGLKIMCIWLNLQILTSRWICLWSRRAHSMAELGIFWWPASL